MEKGACDTEADGFVAGSTEGAKQAEGQTTLTWEVVLVEHSERGASESGFEDLDEMSVANGRTARRRTR